MKPKAIYPLSGDPVHNGHMNTLAFAVNSGFFDEVRFSMGHNSKKKYLFSTEEKMYLAKKAMKTYGIDMSKVRIESFSGLLRNHAKMNGIDYVVRGSRNAEDFNYEVSLADFNSEYGLETFIVPAPDTNKRVSSGTMKALVNEGALVHEHVHPATKQALEERLRNTSLIAVTGNMGTGKSSFCKELVEYSKKYSDLKIHHLDFDQLIHAQYDGNSLMNKKVREKIAQQFGKEVIDWSQKVDRIELGKVIFENLEKRQELAEILRTPATIEFENTIKDLNGIVLVDAAYVTEYDMLPFVNYNVIFTKCGEKERMHRVAKRDNISFAEAEKRSQSQQPPELKRKIIRESQEKMDHGFFYEVDTESTFHYKKVVEELEKNFPMFKSGREE